MPKKQCYYKILNCKNDSSEKEIKTQYRKLAMKYHPDHNPDDIDAEKKCKEIIEAYSVLSDPSKKELYDKYGHAGLDENDLNFNFEDFLDNFSGLRDIFSASRNFVREKSKMFVKKDINLDLEVTIDESFNQSIKSVKYEFKEYDEDNEDYINKSSELKFRLPKNLNNGQKIKLENKGNLVKNKDRGDLILKIKLNLPENLKIEGSDIVLDYTIDIFDALLNKEKEIDFHGKNIKFNIPKNIQNGQKIRLKGKGLNPESDLYLKVFIELPKVSLSQDIISSFRDIEKKINQ